MRLREISIAPSQTMTSERFFLELELPQEQMNQSLLRYDQLILATGSGRTKPQGAWLAGRGP